jgi:IPT/TIG domain
MPSTTCGSLKPGESCTVTISYQPSQLAAITAHITLHSNFGTISIPVTGTGVAPAPKVTAVSPASGSHLGGTRITVTGANLVKVSAITVGGTNATAVSCSSATTCAATTPAGTVGARDVRVVTATGTSAVSTADRFTYQ